MAPCYLYAALFRDLHIHTPTRLVKFYESEKAMTILHGTQSPLLGEILFYKNAWKLQSLNQKKSSYIVTILSATKFPLKLQVLQASSFATLHDEIGPGWSGTMRSLTEGLRIISTDPVFLPKLEAIVEAEYLCWDFLCRNRPVKFLSTFHSSEVHVETYSKYNEQISTSLTPEPRYTLSKPEHKLAAREIGTAIRESKGNHLMKYYFGSVSLIIRSFKETRNQSRQSVSDDLPSYIGDMILAADFASDNIRSLIITFDPNPACMPIQEQLKEVEGLHSILPTLEKVTILHPAIHWCRKPAHENMYRNADNPSNIRLVWSPEPSPHETSPEIIQRWLISSKSTHYAHKIPTRQGKMLG